ncbi:hypothetical protein JHN59_40030 [Streptomyces sp. MBT49]|uniref:hypothetical protein n=1 Tax=Streptomyces TaxID=1883 RepID=UPI00190E56C6|nr:MULTISPECIES: hypothetical protein [unclassified Streptomyces]MBK3630876.1 hypothetical protein [Streptomyces sp. MBT49]MBK3637822.1 hypothetical protein [Streptomyces sp. MBT97]
MRSAGKFSVPAVAAAVLLTVSGCSKDEPAAQQASPSELAHYTAAPGTAAATPSPTKTSPAPCVKTRGMSVAQLTDYLKELRSGSGEYKSKGLTLDSSGLDFTPEAIRRPCEAVTVKLARYWVDIKKTREGTAVTPDRYEYDYSLIGFTSYKAGPQDGRVPDSAPPSGNGCQGTISVAYLGEDVPLSALPSNLELNGTTAPVPVDVDGDGVLSAIYVSPVDVESC